MKLIKNSFIYLGTEIINKAIPFLLLPIITSYLTPTEYGVYGMYQVLFSFLTPFIMMSLDVNITRNFFRVSKEKLSKILSSIIIILHINVFIGLVVIFFISLFFNNPFGIPNKILYIMPLIIYAQTVNTFNLTILRNKEEALKYGIFQIITTIINFSLVLILLIGFKLGWKSLVYSVLIAQFVMMIYSYYYLNKNYSLFTSFYSFKEIYKISLPLIFHLLGGSIIFLSDRIFIQQMKGLKQVGLYSIGNQFGMITMIVINSIIAAISPWIYKKLSKEYKIDKFLYLGMVGFFLLGLIIWIIDLMIFPYMVNKSYLMAKGVIFWISLAFVFRGWYQLFYNKVVYYGKTSIFMYITFLAGILNIILNYFLIKLNGMIGAAQATTMAFLFMFFSIYLYINKYEKEWIYNEKINKKNA